MTDDISRRDVLRSGAALSGLGVAGATDSTAPGVVPCNRVTDLLLNCRGNQPDSIECDATVVAGDSTDGPDEYTSINEAIASVEPGSANDPTYVCVEGGTDVQYEEQVLVDKDFVALLPTKDSWPEQNRPEITAPAPVVDIDARGSSASALRIVEEPGSADDPAVRVGHTGEEGFSGLYDTRVKAITDGVAVESRQARIRNNDIIKVDDESTHQTGTGIDVDTTAKEMSMQGNFVDLYARGAVVRAGRSTIAGNEFKWGMGKQGPDGDGDGFGLQVLAPSGIVVDSVSIERNVFEGNHVGLLVTETENGDVGDITVRRCNFVHNTVGKDVAPPGPAGLATVTETANGREVGEMDPPVDARRNWWNDERGPTREVPDEDAAPRTVTVEGGDRVTGGVDFRPWSVTEH